MLARPLLDADPARHTVALTSLDRMTWGAAAPALLLTVERRGELAGAVLRVESRPVAVSALPPGCAAHVERYAADVDPEQRGATGPVAEVEAYAAARAARTGTAPRVTMRTRLFRLVALVTPGEVEGCARTAGHDDVDLLVSWQAAFASEAIGALNPPSDPRPGLLQSMDQGAGHVLWEVDCRPVSYAAARRPVAGMSRIAPVYTPPEHRGHGYGSAVTAATTAWALAAGARDVVLFTDLANPVSNAIYPRLGYRPVHDALEVAFE